ncbi:hypothetical protein ACJJTC_017750 [Scirpophaga incertulas]
MYQRIALIVSADRSARSSLSALRVSAKRFSVVLIAALRSTNVDTRRKMRRAIIIAALYYLSKRKKKVRRRLHVLPLIEQRAFAGEFVTLYGTLRADETKFETKLLSNVDANFRRITSKDRLQTGPFQLTTCAYTTD